MTSVRSRRRSFLQYVADNNPFYLLSAASMLLACLLLSNTTTWSPIAARKLVMLIVTLNVYELLLVGLGLYLIARRNHLRDGVMLLILEAVFLADVGFLNSELYTESLRTGLVVNAVLLVVGLMKLAAIFRTLGVPLVSPVFALTTATLVTLLGHAALFRWMSTAHAGRLPDGVMYAAWWALAGLLAAYALMTRWTPRHAFGGTRAGVRERGLGHVFMGLMLASLAAHFGTSHWIYSCPFQAPDVSPVLLGLAVLTASVGASIWANHRDLKVLSALLPIAAVLTAQAPSPRLATAMQSVGIATAQLTAVVAYLVLVYAFALRRFFRFAGFGVAAAALYVFGPTWATVQQWAQTVGDLIARGGRWLAAALDRVTPRTQGAWGTIALAGAFVMLAIGAAINLLRPKHDDHPDADLPPVPPAPMADVPAEG